MNTGTQAEGMFTMVVQQCYILSLCCVILQLSSVICVPIEENISEIVVEMPPTAVTEKDTYLCYARPISEAENSFVVGFEIRADSKCVHHAVVAACQGYHSDQTTWDCRSQQGHVCSGKSIVFGNWDGWSKKHEGEMFPSDVNVAMGSSTSYKYIVTQVHYKEPTQCIGEKAANISLYTTNTRRPYTFQIVGMGSTGSMPPNSIGFHADSACVWKGVTVYAYLFEVHTHTRGRFVEGYRVRHGIYTLIGSGKPVRSKESSAVIGGPIEIKPGDIIAARCTFDITDQDAVKFAHGAKNEMCNFDINVKLAVEDQDAYNSSIHCFKDARTFSFRGFIGRDLPEYDPIPRR